MVIQEDCAEWRRKYGINLSSSLYEYLFWNRKVGINNDDMIINDDDNDDMIINDDNFTHF